MASHMLSFRTILRLVRRGKSKIKKKKKLRDQSHSISPVALFILVLDFTARQMPAARMRKETEETSLPKVSPP